MLLHYIDRGAGVQTQLVNLTIRTILYKEILFVLSPKVLKITN